MSASLNQNLNLEDASFAIKVEPVDRVTNTDEIEALEGQSAVGSCSVMSFPPVRLRQSEKFDGDKDKSDGDRDKLDGDRDKLDGDRDKSDGDRDKLDGDRDKSDGDRDKLDGDRDKLDGDRDKLSPVSCKGWWVDAPHVTSDREVMGYHYQSVGVSVKREPLEEDISCEVKEEESSSRDQHSGQIEPAEKPPPPPPPPPDSESRTDTPTYLAEESKPVPVTLVPNVFALQAAAEDRAVKKTRSAPKGRTERPHVCEVCDVAFTQTVCT
ncbi:hypothetical protein ACOMHN_057521 [Nucella lapillus]